MYRVIVPFNDLQDDSYRYEAGDVYPRNGKRAKLARIEELSSTENKRGIILIEEIPEEVSKAEEILPEEEPVVVKRKKKSNA